MTETVVRLKPLQYVHVHDNNTNVTSLECGPRTITLLSHQVLLTPEPQSFIAVTPNEYAVIENPFVRAGGGGGGGAKGAAESNRTPALDKHGQVRIRLGEREIRFFQEPFPLYPKELLVKIERLVILGPQQALVLKVTRDFEDTDGSDTDAGSVEKKKGQATATVVKRVAGDEYLVRGPRTYMPRVEVDVIELREATVVRYNEALQLRAVNKHVDAAGVTRAAGEEYLITRPGAYMVGVDETVVAVIKARVLTERLALHVECAEAFVDPRPWARRCSRKPGEQYLVTVRETAEFTPLPTERIVRDVALLVVNHKQWAVVLDPVIDGRQHLGGRRVVTNCSIFLHPGESLEGSGVKDAYVLAADEAVLLTAIEEFEDATSNPPVARVSGEQWLVHGPCEYIPTSAVRVVKDPKTGEERRRRFVLSESEGIYVRDSYSGIVRTVTNCTYMLEAHEELWSKPLSKIVEEKLAQQGNSHAAYMDRAGGKLKPRDQTRAVRYAIPHNAVTQVYDFKLRTQRTIFGPEAVMLGPEEEFTVLSLSGSEWDPKRPNVCLPKKPDFIKSLYLFLGPSSLSDVVFVETSDHARLQLQLSYDWFFDVEPGNAEQANECFRVPDFVGDCCSCIASRVRASIASIPFKQFHTHSSAIVRGAVFGYEKGSTDRPKPHLKFPSNRLVVTSVDIQEIEVVDQKTREALLQSVKMAIEITTQAQEASARQDAQVREQQARGRLDRQQIQDKAAAEVERKRLLEFETQCSAIASTGRAKAEARARAEAAEIEGDAAVQVARTKAKTSTAMDATQNELRKRRDQLFLNHRAQRDAEDVRFQREITETESSKFKRTMDSIGAETVTELARAGPELQAKLLKGLGLEGYLVTDGTNPINLFNTAKGMTAAPPAAAAAAAHVDPRGPV